MSIGIVCGETRRGPFSRSMSHWPSRVVRAADAGGDDDAEPLLVDLGRAGVRPGLARGDERELLGPVELACLDAVHDLARVDGHLCGDPHGQLVGPPSSMTLTPERPASRPSQVDGDVAAERGRRSETGDDDAWLRAHVLLP